MQNRAYSVLEIKSIDEDLRVIEGTATTPKTDRMEDIVEPEGATFSLPLPFLMHHDSRLPVGHVTAAKATADGIPVTIRLQKTDEPGLVKDRLDAAWQDIKLKLVRGLSIGFNPLEWSEIKGTFGYRYTKWEWLELSGVTIPANMEATITTVKSCDIDRAATGNDGDVAVPPRVRGSVKLMKPKPQEGNVKTATEQIRDFENTRAAKSARMSEIQEKAASEGRTKDEAEQQEFDTLRGELASIDKELVDLRFMETQAVAKAAPVNGASTDAAAASRGTHVVVKEPTLKPGIRLARVAKCMALAHKQHKDVDRIALELYPDDKLVQKAVAAGSTASGSWAEDLVGETTSVFADFVEFLRPQTIIGKFGTNGIPGLRSVPFRVPLITQTGAGDGYWVGEGKAKPLTSFDFTRRTLEPLKVANIAVLTEEVLRSSSPSAETIIRDELVNALRQRLDVDFINPDKAAEAGVSPASITHGITPIPSSGTDADAVRADIVALLAGFLADNNTPSSGVLIMPSSVALRLSMFRNPLGQPEFAGLTMNGGTLAGLPVIVSDNVSSDDYGTIVVLANAQDVYLADDGGFRVDMSDQASLEMTATPAHNSTSPTPAQLVSMFQTNSVAFRAERYINWLRRRESSVQFLSDVNWA